MDAPIVSIDRLRAALDRARALDPAAPISAAVAAVAQAFALSTQTVCEALEIDEPVST